MNLMSRGCLVALVLQTATLYAQPAPRATNPTPRVTARPRTPAQPAMTARGTSPAPSASPHVASTGEAPMSRVEAPRAPAAPAVTPGEDPVQRVSRGGFDGGLPRPEAPREDPRRGPTAPGQAEVARRGVEVEAREPDPCAEVLRAVRLEDLRGAERAYTRCRARVSPAGRIPVVDDLRALEDATEALHGLRRGDGAFCVAPTAPFDLAGPLSGARDSRACFVALERFLTDEEALTRFLLDDPYTAGRLASRAGLDIALARRTRRRMTLAPEVEQEAVGLARLVGRHFMRACRCLPGPQPDTAGEVRAMRLPPTIQTVLLRGLTERSDTVGEGSTEAPRRAMPERDQ
ncbi:MAG: hypothetical protein JNK72_04525 [Myxococcales bacterium]|nr:hypothetical protein [Myxococcales bacterium]